MRWASSLLVILISLCVLQLVQGACPADSECAEIIINNYPNAGSCSPNPCTTPPNTVCEQAACCDGGVNPAKWYRCVASPCVPSPEVCDNLDNDCDDPPEADEGLEPDSCQLTCESSAADYWTPGNFESPGTTPNCCGDDVGEFPLHHMETTDPNPDLEIDDTSIFMCCNAATDCAKTGALCYETGERFASNTNLCIDSVWWICNAANQCQTKNVAGVDYTCYFVDPGYKWLSLPQREKCWTPLDDNDCDGMLDDIDPDCDPDLNQTTCEAWGKNWTTIDENYDENGAFIGAEQRKSCCGDNDPRVLDDVGKEFWSFYQEVSHSGVSSSDSTKYECCNVGTDCVWEGSRCYPQETAIDDKDFLCDAVTWYECGDDNECTTRTVNGNEYQCYPVTSFDHDWRLSSDPPAEQCGDGVDNDCSGGGDVPCCTLKRYYADVDNDGYGNPSSSRWYCSPTGVYRVQNSGDCNDNQWSVNPGNSNGERIVDNECTNTWDDECDGEDDYDTLSTSAHGDSGCPVAVDDCVPSDSTPDVGNTFTISCNASVGNVNSITATPSATGSCSFDSWNGNNAEFTCSFTSTGAASVTCGIDVAKSYQSGADQVCTINVQAGVCAGAPATRVCGTGSCGLETQTCNGGTGLWEWPSPANCVGDTNNYTTISCNDGNGCAGECADYCETDGSYNGVCDFACVSVQNWCDEDCDNINETCVDGACRICGGGGTFCGDGTPQTPNDDGENENCDDGVLSGNTDMCMIDNVEGYTCEIATCGDGYVCEDVSCTSGPAGGAEECDDGDADNTNECDNSCANTGGGVGFCGDGTWNVPNDLSEGGVIDDGEEECDGDEGLCDWATESCGQANSDNECVCVPLDGLSWCGDNTWQPVNGQGENEECDGMDIGACSPVTEQCDSGTCSCVPSSLSGFGNLSGYVHDFSDAPILGASVSVVSPPSGFFSPPTNAAGYEIFDIPVGWRYISASKAGYRSVTVLYNILPGNNILNFNLSDGDCEACADWENRCSISCSGNDQCGNGAVTVPSECDGARPGEWVLNETGGNYIQCCEGVRQRTKTSIAAEVGGCMDELVKHTRIVYYLGQPVSLEVYTWEPCR